MNKLTDSEKEFIIDQYIRSFENRDTLYEIGLTEQQQSEIIDTFPCMKLKLLQSLYKHIESSIYKNVKLYYGDERAPVTETFYHPKFGWVVKAKNATAYLGKVNALRCEVTIGDHSYFSSSVELKGNGKLFIGKFTSIANNATIHTSNTSHPTDFVSTYNLGGNLRILNEGKHLEKTFYDNVEFKEDCNIGHDVWVGEGVTIMNGVTLGNGCIIGTKALVTKDCEPYGIYGGVPAKLIRYRFSKKAIDKLTQKEWWNWSMDKIIENESFFLISLEEAPK